MGSVGEGELGRWEKMDGGRVGGEERILVSVRLRPLNGIELSRSDPSDWECINTTTIVYRNGLAERSSALPSAYTFDRVFGCECTTRQVYEDTAKEVALSVVSGINSSIFAYGQTSSGKTYTMTGITEYSVADIYDYIQKHEERDFVLKFSAIEIYNEAVRDLLSNDSSPLRLLDDPERGTVVDRLTEETLRDWGHLKELLSVCEAQRQIGETSLNEMSSRSHQILRLTIESSAREFLGKDSFSTLTASVNFVDLAGSERASQALSAGTRLKEGCHINRSLLTLGTVIRKLSKGRNGHVPYRDSKLTRILQSSLGGNARTAIICTMSPARSHMEQSRNTLLFATCAKEVVNSARVNVVMSDKVLVKHLQRELARLESELKYPSSASSTSVSDALKEKDSRIRKLEKEIKELIQQRDLAQSRLEDLLRAVGDDQGSRDWDELSQYSASHVLNAYEDALSISDTSGVTYQTQDFGITGFDSSIRSQSCNGLQIRLSEAQKEEHATAAVTLSSSAQFNHRTDQIKGPKMILRGPFTDFEDLCKEVRCIEMEESKRTTSEDFNLFLTEESEFLVPVTIDSTEPGYQELKPDLKTDTTSVVEELVQNGISNGDLAKPYLDEPSPLQLVQKEEVQNVETNATAVELHPDGSSPLTSMEEKSISRSLSLSKSRSCEAMLMTSLPAEQSDKTPPTDDLKECMGRPERIQRRHMTLDYRNDVEKLQVGDSTEANASRKVFTKPNGMTASEEDITSICKFVDGLKEMAQVQYQKDLADKQELETAIDHDFGMKKTVKDVGLDPVTNPSESPSRWPMDFEKRQRELIELWHACNVSLVHRTCFFLLFKGDPADSIYLEVEHRRLSFLKNTLSQGNLSRTTAEDGHKVTLASSMRNLQREREMLCRQMQKRLSSTEREGLYAKWGIALDSKRRRMQLAKLLWSDTKDMDNVKESASIVANLIGLMETGRALKETFGLSFTPQVRSRRSYSWINGLSSF